jgi:hypothetical protein
MPGDIMATSGRKKVDTTPCQWISGLDAFRLFATHAGGVQSARHIKPLHWYVACRLVLEGGFHPDDVTPRPPFDVIIRRRRALLSYNPASGGTGERIVLGGLKTKNVDVVITKPGIGPVMAVSCKGVTKAFRNLTNRMEETIGECTNLHITYPAMVIGYFALVRANRTVEDALEAPDLADEDDAAAAGSEPQEEATANETVTLPPRAVEQIAANDIVVCIWASGRFLLWEGPGDEFDLGRPAKGGRRAPARTGTPSRRARDLGKRICDALHQPNADRLGDEVHGAEGATPAGRSADKSGGESAARGLSRGRSRRRR